MARNAPKVFVGVPVYNEEKYIDELLDSIYRQKYLNMKILISDNASTDNTWGIIQKYVKKDNRFLAIRQNENIRATENFEYVLEQSDGDYFIFAGGHDVWGDDLIQICVDQMERDDSINLVAPLTLWIGEDGLRIPQRKVENIDTRFKKTMAGRVHAFWSQINRCSCFYGLFKRDFIVNNFKTPKIVNSDFYILINAAATGNVVTSPNCCWFRRVIRKENRDEQKERYRNVLNLSKLSMRFPLITSRLITLIKLFSFQGSIKDRALLLKFAINRFFLSPPQLKILFEELKNK